MYHTTINTLIIRFSALAAAFLLVFALAVPPASRAESKLQIMTATTDLASLAQEVGGDKVDVQSIARGYQDPHFVEAKPSFLLKLRRADLLIVVGLELEIGWLPPLITQSTNPKIQVGAPGYLDASRFAKILEIPTGQVTRAEGDVHVQRIVRLLQTDLNLPRETDLRVRGRAGEPVRADVIEGEPRPLPPIPYARPHIRGLHARDHAIIPTFQHVSLHGPREK